MPGKPTLKNSMKTAKPNLCSSKMARWKEPKKLLHNYHKLKKTKDLGDMLTKDNV
jgi:hypothetical protein